MLIQFFALPYGRQLRAKISFVQPSDPYPFSGLLQSVISLYEMFLIGISFLKRLSPATLFVLEVRFTVPTHRRHS